MAKRKKVEVEQSEVAIELIDEGKRFREDYGDLVELEQSIRANGLISPIAVARFDGEAQLMLIAGGRRLRACKQIGMSVIPTRIYNNPDELELRVIELAENLHRKDMTWKETTTLQREIHLLKQKKFGTPTPGPAAEGVSTGWRLSDTADMLGVSEATISNSIKIQESMESNPGFNWDGCATLKDALKLSNTIKEAQARSELARRAEAKKGGNVVTLKAKLMDSYVIGNAITGMQNQDDEVFDFAEIDPPYGIDLPDMKANNDCLGYNEIPGHAYLVFIKDVLTEAYRILKPDSYCVLWFGLDPWLEYIYKVAMDVGFSGVRTPGVWVKPNGQSMSPNASLAQAYETFFVLRKGKPILAQPGRHNVFAFSPVPPQAKVHPTQRPVELITEILRTFTFENAKIISPFLGSGTTIVAAALNKRHAMGFDLADQYKGGFINLLDEHFVGE